MYARKTRAKISLQISRLISAFGVRCLDSMIVPVSILKMLRLAEPVSLCQNPYISIFHVNK